MHFIFAQKYLDDGDNRPQNAYASLGKLGFFSLSLKLKVMLFFWYKM